MAGGRNDYLRRVSTAIHNTVLIRGPAIFGTRASLSIASLNVMVFVALRNHDLADIDVTDGAVVIRHVTIFLAGRQLHLEVLPAGSVILLGQRQPLGVRRVIGTNLVLLAVFLTGRSFVVCVVGILILMLKRINDLLFSLPITTDVALHAVAQTRLSTSRGIARDSLVVMVLSIRLNLVHHLRFATAIGTSLNGIASSQTGRRNHLAVHEIVAQHGNGRLLDGLSAIQIATNLNLHARLGTSSRLVFGMFLVLNIGMAGGILVSRSLVVTILTFYNSGTLNRTGGGNNRRFSIVFQLIEDSLLLRNLLTDFALLTIAHAGRNTGRRRTGNGLFRVISSCNRVRGILFTDGTHLRHSTCNGTILLGVTSNNTGLILDLLQGVRDGDGVAMVTSSGAFLFNRISRGAAAIAADLGPVSVGTTGGRNVIIILPVMGQRFAGSTLLGVIAVAGTGVQRIRALQTGRTNLHTGVQGMAKRIHGHSLFLVAAGTLLMLSTLRSTGRRHILCMLGDILHVMAQGRNLGLDRQFHLTNGTLAALGQASCFTGRIHSRNNFRRVTSRSNLSLGHSNLATNSALLTLGQAGSLTARRNRRESLFGVAQRIFSDRLGITTAANVGLRSALRTGSLSTVHVIEVVTQFNLFRIAQQEPITINVLEGMNRISKHIGILIKFSFAAVEIDSRTIHTQVAAVSVLQHRVGDFGGNIRNIGTVLLRLTNRGLVAQCNCNFTSTSTDDSSTAGRGVQTGIGYTACHDDLTVNLNSRITVSARNISSTRRIRQIHVRNTRRRGYIAAPIVVVINVHGCSSTQNASCALTNNDFRTRLQEHILINRNGARLDIKGHITIDRQFVIL